MVDYCLRMKGLAEANGLKLTSMGCRCPLEVSLGLPGRDRMIESWCHLIQAMGQARIPIFGYNFKPITIIRTDPQTGRGGAKYSSFSYDEYLKNRDPDEQALKIEEDRMWENLQILLERIVPVAEASGVRLALHPDDPPMAEPLEGYPRIVSSLEHYERIFSMVPSDSNGMFFCQGCVTEMGLDVYEAIRRIGRLGKIVCVHFRNVRGSPTSFQEVFVDEGDVDMFKAMRAYREIGFSGPFMMDHTPDVPGDREGRIGRAYAVGYIRSLIQAVYR
jgi:mannonate dehydratase